MIVIFAEFVEINDQMDQISSFLDDLEQKNDNLQVRKLEICSILHIYHNIQ
jgi:hypothetical protein